MKICNAYDEEFGHTSDASAMQSRPQFNVTMIDSSVLIQRLATELHFVICELQRVWPELRHDPIGVSTRAVLELTNRLRRMLLMRNAFAGVTTALLLVLSAVLSLLIAGRITAKTKASCNLASEEGAQIVLVDITAPEPKTGAGIGTGGKGRVGLDHGRGEGSAAERKLSSGGGGGGNNNPTPTQQGRIPPPSVIPALINPPLPNAALAVAGVDLDPALWRNLPFPDFGDPRSKSTVPSKGPGTGGGMGTNEGLGIGDGRDNGVGPGDGGNTGGGRKGPGGGGPGGSHGDSPGEPTHVFRVPEVTQRARVLFKPEPQYTEEARRTDVTGSVVLRVVFSSTGEVTNIHAIKTLPGGLTEKAMAAARQIRFVPATKDGHPVSTYMQLEYNFNLY